MADKITKGYVNHYQTITMTQTLPSGRNVYAKYVRIGKDKWNPIYSTDSAYHICPYDGQFRDCKVCDVTINGLDCISHEEVISSAEMASRATACANAKNCTINFMGF